MSFFFFFFLIFKCHKAIWQYQSDPSLTKTRWQQNHEQLASTWSIVTSWINSLSPRRFERNLRKVIFKLILMIGGWGIFCKIALRWMSMDLTDDKSTLVQVMAWCRQATSHYLSQCWPRSMSPYDVTRPQWVKSWFKYCMSIHRGLVIPHGGVDLGQHWFR